MLIAAVAALPRNDRLGLPPPEPTPTGAACAIGPGMGLPRGAKGTKQSLIKSSGPVKGKKVIFSRAGVQLVFPFSLAAHLQRFLAHNGPASFPEERALLAHLQRQAARGDDITIDAAYPWYRGPRNIMKRRVSFLLADLLAAGEFEIRAPGASAPVMTLTMAEYGSYCGELCGVGGRAFLLPGCKVVLYTVDWIS